jgi:hypothetical protein
MLGVKVALAVAAIVIAVAIAAVLSRAPAVVAGTNGFRIAGQTELLKGDTSSCQRLGTVPQGTSAFRISVGSGAGPWVHLRLISGGRVVTQGELPAGWGLEADAVIPVRPLSHAVSNPLLCTTLGPIASPATIEGTRRPSEAEHTSYSDVALRVEYLRPGTRSWWSLASSVAYRMGLGRAVSGTWIAYLALLLTIAVGVLAWRLALDDLR